MRQTGGNEQSALRCTQGTIERRGILRRRQLAELDGMGGDGELSGRSEGGREVELQAEGIGMTASFFQIGLDGMCVCRVVIGENVGVSHVQDFQAEEAGLLLRVCEGGIGEAHEPVVVVVDAVIDAEGAVGADVGGGMPACCRKGV